MGRVGALPPWNKGAAPRSTRYFGRQFYDPREVPEPPEATGILRARLSYRYPRPWKCQDPQVWRYPDLILPNIQYPRITGHVSCMTRLCYRQDHVDRKQPEILLANPHLVPSKKPRPQSTKPSNHSK